MKTTHSFGIIPALLFAGTLALSPSLRADEKWDISKLDLSKLPPASSRTDATYAKDIQPMLKGSCVQCHNGERHKGGLRVDSLEALLKGGDDGKAVVPGDSKASLMVAAVAQVNDRIAMPPKPRKGPHGAGAPNGGNPPPSGPGNPGGPQAAPGGNTPGPGATPMKHGPPPKPLTAEQVGLIRAWIDQGAK